MTRRRTPQERKHDEYTKDSVPIVNSVQGFRKSWPRKKARANRAYRRTVNQVVDTLTVRQEEDISGYTDPEGVRRIQVRKWYRVEPMGDVIKRRREERVIRAIRNFLHGEYDNAMDREQFRAFLSSQVGGRTENSRILAECLKDAMDPSLESIWYPDGWLHTHGGKWLRAFFQDEPEWEERVRNWITSFEQAQRTHYSDVYFAFLTK